MPVLVAYDGKEYTERALDHAIEYSIAFSKVLYIVSMVASKDDVERENELNYIKEVLETARQKAADRGAEVRALLGAGNPAVAILETADRVNASTIVIGRSGKTKLDRVVLGSVSEHIIRNAHCIVVVVP